MPSQQLPDLSALELSLYERQLQLPHFGVERQRRLKGASVMISRVGGLGGTVAMLLARAGVGRLVLAHGGVLVHENLNRMPLAFRAHLGTSRMAAFEATLRQINPDVALVTEGAHVNNRNAPALIGLADLVVDASPEFAERYVMNAVAMHQAKPLIMAAMFGLEGYVTTFEPGRTPCLSCLYPEPPEDWTELGFPVIAPTSTLVAAIAAMEAIKVVTGMDGTLHNVLLYCDLGSNTFRRMDIHRRDDCAVCSRHFRRAVA
jgi:molybdopterin/thiamine biosynthesis adenylyltransferase